jgi:regulatory protein
MEIQSIKQGKTKSIITADGKEYDFSNEVIFTQRLQEGEIGAKQFFELKEKSDCLLAKQYLFGLLARSQKSKKDAATRLRQKGFGSKAVNFAIQKAEEYSLLNDDYYAQCYVKTYSRTKGRRLLEYELKRQGIDEQIIQRVFEEEPDTDDKTALAAARKYIRLKGERATRDKLYRSLAQKGFNNDSIIRAIESIFSDQNDYED